METRSYPGDVWCEQDRHFDGAKWVHSEIWYHDAGGGALVISPFVAGALARARLTRGNDAQEIEALERVYAQAE